MALHTLVSSTELLGWGAAALTLSTFVCADMRRLRLLALAANATFIAYGALAGLLPVLVLHLLLVPVNLWRLAQTLERRRPAPARARQATLAAEPVTAHAAGKRAAPALRLARLRPRLARRAAAPAALARTGASAQRHSRRRAQA